MMDNIKKRLLIPEPKTDAPKWILFLYSYYVVAWCFPKLFISTIFRPAAFPHYHYSWERKDLIDEENLKRKDVDLEAISKY